MVLVVRNALVRSGEEKERVVVVEIIHSNTEDCKQDTLVRLRRMLLIIAFVKGGAVLITVISTATEFCRWAGTC